ncbi:hypothetical protein ACIBH1_07650 [Nonomuraea sp. NPDC050663]|uniref:hypothetical protein n=1 Tax=Nonomuraea sp. NPDC050663 TaxID=3364370 RepID=UPI003799B7E0
MSHGDDIDARFAELMEQFDQGDRRRMQAAATKAASKASRQRHPSVRGHRRRRAWLAVWSVVAIVTVAGVMVTLQPDWLGAASLEATGPVPEETAPVRMGPPSDGEGAAEGTAEGTVEASATPTVAQTPAGPFAGSPAEQYADGEAGLVLPKAKAMGGLSKKQVAAGIDRVRELLAAAHLDRPTLMGGKPKAFMKLLDPAQRAWFTEHLDRRKGDQARRWVTSFAPKTAELVTDVIKVHGKSSLAAFKDQAGRRGVKIKTNFLFVYAIQRPGQPHTSTRLIAHDIGEVLLYANDVRWLRLWNNGGVTGARCDAKDGFVHPAYVDSVPDEEQRKGRDKPRIDPYDLDRERHPGECRKASRV